MAQTSDEDERHQTVLVPVQPASGSDDTPGAGVRAGRPPGRRRPAAPHPRRAGSPLPGIGGEFLSASLALLCRSEPLSAAEIGDHADVVAEVADALAAVADRLSQDLERAEPGATADDADGPAAELARSRDALQHGSAQARRGAAELWTRHIAALRTQIENARALTHVADPSR